MEHINVGILGATGAVGQKFIRLLTGHPWFNIAGLGASQRSAGKLYREALHWIEDIALPAEAADLPVTNCLPEHFRNCTLVFSGLDSSVAGQTEQAFAEAGIPVISNAKNFRLHEQVPLLIPEINPEHTGLIERQTFTEDGSGWIVTNPNCVSVPLAMSLKPFYESYGVESAVVTSMQSVSGAGYPGVASMDILGNVIPYIDGEEEKVSTESLKILGVMHEDSVELANFPIQATAVRVPTLEGHLLSVTLTLEKGPAHPDELNRTIEEWQSPIADLELPSAPSHPLKLYTDPRFPQPRLHADRQNGMQTAIGRLRITGDRSIAYVVMAHNTIRGAAGGAVLNAELLVEKGYIG